MYGPQAVRAALDRLVVDLCRPENQTAWQALARMEPGRSRIELFDMVWWMYFSPQRSGKSASALEHP